MVRWLGLLLWLMLLFACGTKATRQEQVEAQRAERLAEVRHVWHENGAEPAIVLVEALSRSIPDDPAVLALKGRMLTQLGRYDEAVEVLDLALKVKVMAETHLDRALSLRGLGKFKEADASLERADGLFTERLQAKSGDRHTKLHLAMISHLRGNTRSALDQIKVILAEKPDSKAALELRQTIDQDTTASMSSRPKAIP